MLFICNTSGKDQGMSEKVGILEVGQVQIFSFE